MVTEDDRRETDGVQGKGTFETEYVSTWTGRDLK